MDAADVMAIGDDAAGLLDRAAADLRAAVDIIGRARIMAAWQSPAGELAREELLRHETDLLSLGDETAGAAATVRAVAARGEG